MAPVKEFIVDSKPGRVPTERRGCASVWCREMLEPSGFGKSWTSSRSERGAT